MITALTGELKQVGEDGRVMLGVGPVVYEVMVCAFDIPELQERLSQELSLHTIFYLEGDASRGNLEPRLIGFLRAKDRRFFELFTTVKGIGPRTALRALTVPSVDIAQAVEGKDARALSQLKGIGKRTAELIIAELSGKLGAFLGDSPAQRPAQAASRRSADEEDAIRALIQLGERRADAERLLDRVKQASPKLSSVDELFRGMLRMRDERA